MSELPSTIGGPSAWYGPDLASKTDWIERLSPAGIAEIKAAARQLLRSDIDWQTIRAEAFPLPTFQPRLADSRRHPGRPGLRVAAGTAGRVLGPTDPSALAFLGLGLHWGRFCSQNRYGHLLGHVKDLGLSSQNPDVRIYQTRERQNYHTDSCDVVCLLCLHPAKAGGLSSLVSPSRFTTRCSSVVPTWHECCLNQSKPIGGAKCPSAASRSSASPCSTGIAVCCQPYINAATSNRRGDSPAFLRFRLNR